MKKPNFVLDKKEDISNNSKNISSWNGLTCELVRFSFLEALEEKLSDLVRDLSGIFM